MKKKLLYLLAVFFVCLLVGYGWLQWRHRQALAERTPRSLLDCRKSSIYKIEILRQMDGQAEKVVLARTDKPAAGIPEQANLLNAEWQMQSPQQAEADEAIMRMMSQAFCELQNYQLVTDSSLDKLGLESAAVELSLFGKNESGAEKIFKARVSAISPAGAGEKNLTYVAVEKDGKWLPYYAPIALRRVFAIPAARLRNHQLVKMQIHDIQMAKIQISGRPVLRLERSGGDWRVFSGEKDLGTGDEAGKYVNRIGTVSALSLKANDGGPELCSSVGSKELSIAIELSGIANRKEMIRLAAPKKVPGLAAPQMLACNSNRRAVFYIHGDMWNYLSIPAQKLVNKR